MGTGLICDTRHPVGRWWSSFLTLLDQNCLRMQMVDMDDGQATLVLRRCDEWCVDYLLFLQVLLGANRCTAAQSMPVA